MGARGTLRINNPGAAAAGGEGAPRLGPRASGPPSPTRAEPLPLFQAGTEKGAKETREGWISGCRQIEKQLHKQLVGEMQDYGCVRAGHGVRKQGGLGSFTSLCLRNSGFYFLSSCYEG